MEKGIIMYSRNSPNRIKSVTHGLKGVAGNIASLLFYPPFAIAAIHKMRGVKIKNIWKVYFSFNVLIDNVFPELVTIGEDVWLTRNVCVLAHFNPSEGQRKYLGDIVCKKTVVEDGVFVGVNSVILPGVTLGENAVVGAGSVVVDDVPPRTMVAGNPARIIRMLDN